MENKKMINYLNNTKTPYILKVDDMNIEISYSENNKSFNECMVNILKQKS